MLRCFGLVRTARLGPVDGSGKKRSTRSLPVVLVSPRSAHNGWLRVYRPTRCLVMLCDGSFNAEPKATAENGQTGAFGLSLNDWPAALPADPRPLTARNALKFAAESHKLSEHVRVHRTTGHLGADHLGHGP